MKHARRRSLAAIALASAVACSSGGGPTGPAQKALAFLDYP